MKRVGLILRLEYDQTIKAAVLGWMEDLEQVDKTHGSKRVLYWKKLLRKAGIDWTNFGQLTKERKESRP